MFVRRSPHVVSYWRGGRLIAHNYRSNVAVAATPLLIGILDRCSEWRSLTSVTRLFPDYAPSSVGRAIRLLVTSTLIEAARRPTRDADPWSSWDPAAGLLHFSSKDLPYREPQATKAVLKKRAIDEPMPTARKRYRSAPSIALPVPKID